MTIKYTCKLYYACIFINYIFSHHYAKLTNLGPDLVDSKKRYRFMAEGQSASLQRVNVQLPAATVDASTLVEVVSSNVYLS